MRIHVVGVSTTASLLAANLAQAGHVVSDQQPTLMVTIEPWIGPGITVDAPDCRLAHLVTHRVLELVPDQVGVRVVTRSNKNDRAVHLFVPAKDAAASHAVEVGVMRAVDQWVAAEHELAHHNAPSTVLTRKLDALQQDLTAVRRLAQRPLWRKWLGLGPKAVA